MIRSVMIIKMCFVFSLDAIMYFVFERFLSYKDTQTYVYALPIN